MLQILNAFKLRDPGPALCLMAGHAGTHWMIGVFYVLLPFVKDDFGFSYFQAGLLVTAFEVGVFACSLLSGPVVDMTGRRVIFQVLALVAGGLAMAAMSISSDFLLFCFLAALLGGMTQFWHAPATAFLSFYYTSNWGYVIGIHGMGANMGELVGPVLAGLVIGVAGWQAAALMPAVVTITIAVALVIMLMPKDKPPEGESRGGMNLGDYFKGFMGLLRDFGVMTLCVMMGLRSMAQMLIRTFVPLYMKDVMGAAATMIGAVYAVMHIGGMIGNPLAGLASDRYGRRAILMVALLVGTGLILGLTVVGNEILFVAGIGFIGFTLYATRPVTQSWILDMVPKPMHATSVGLRSTIQAVISMPAPAIGGWAADNFGILTVFYGVAVVLLIANGLIFLVPEPERGGKEAGQAAE